MAFEKEIELLKAKQHEIEGLFEKSSVEPTVKLILTSLQNEIEITVRALQSANLAQEEFNELKKTVNVVVNWDREDEGYAYES